MKKNINIFLLVIEIIAFIYIINSNNLYASNKTEVFTVLLNYIILTVFIWFIINNIISIIKINNKDIINSIIKSNDYAQEQIFSCIKFNKEAINLHNTTIGNNIIHTIITDSKLHYEKSIALLNNNLIETHTTHELLKELFMLEQDTNNVLKNYNSEMIVDSIIHSDKTLEESFIDNEIVISIEKDNKTNTRRKKQQS